MATVPEFNKPLAIHETPIPGIVWFDLPVHGDNRGWFKENWQREKMIALGLADFQPIQNNISFNDEVGTTRGLHAEPWDKYVSVASGKVFGAWVDLRAGETFGKTFTLEIDPSKAIFIPRGVANGFQVLEPETAYSYLVNDHWSPNATYAFLNLGDATAAIDWPITLDQAVLSEKDKHHPALHDVVPVEEKKILITGANGQLGRALQAEFPGAEFADRSSFDISNTASWGDRHWKDYGIIINAAAYTAVDAAETPEGKIEAWKANAVAVQNLAKVATEHNITLVTISSDYVFDGTQAVHTESEPLSPLGVYGQTKAAGDLVAVTTPRHYIARTTWVVGDGKNFISTMKALAEKGVKPTVVNDQFGRLTFTEDLAKAIKHLVSTNAPYGIYNITNEGPTESWADYAKAVYKLLGYNPNDITGISTEHYFEGKEGAAPRPAQSTLDLTKIQQTGFTPRSTEEALVAFLGLPAQEKPIQNT